MRNRQPKEIKGHRKALELRPEWRSPLLTQCSFFTSLPLFTSSSSPQTYKYRYETYVWGFRLSKSVCALKIVPLHMQTLVWREIMAANRVTVRG